MTSDVNFSLGPLGGGCVALFGFRDKLANKKGLRYRRSPKTKIRSCCDDDTTKVIRAVKRRD